MLSPVVLFAYARPEHLARTLESLRANAVPLIYAFSDGPRDDGKVSAVEAVRKILRAVDWTEVKLVERPTNLGLGASIRRGVTEVLRHHDNAIVVEDDLISVPGTYRYLSAALDAYRNEPRVMSVTGWTHPRVTPTDVGAQPYFDGRSECLVWGTWARVWEGMNKDALTLMNECRVLGIDAYEYGADLVDMAKNELRNNIWAVRFIYLHIRHGGLCLRPPRSLVEHIGFDASATNSATEYGWTNPPLQECPPIPEQWPRPNLNRQCSGLWQAVYGGPPPPFQTLRRAVRKARRMVARLRGPVR
jgi:hypothetical protein